jgi:bacterioferritin (cytochrome b1)
MKHAEAFAERLAYLGGTPTTKQNPIFVGETLKEMIEREKSDEETAISRARETALTVPDLLVTPTGQEKERRAVIRERFMEMMRREFLEPSFEGEAADGQPIDIK